jgi:hypothetical protein
VTRVSQSQIVLVPPANATCTDGFRQRRDRVGGIRALKFLRCCCQAQPFSCLVLSISAAPGSRGLPGALRIRQYGWAFHFSAFPEMPTCLNRLAENSLLSHDAEPRPEQFGQKTAPSLLN